MPILDQRSLESIESAVLDCRATGAGIPGPAEAEEIILSCCETIRAAWDQREWERAKRNAELQVTLALKRERDAVREQVKQLREALETALLYIPTANNRLSEFRAVLENTR